MHNTPGLTALLLVRRTKHYEMHTACSLQCLHFSGHYTARPPKFISNTFFYSQCTVHIIITFHSNYVDTQKNMKALSNTSMNCNILCIPVLTAYLPLVSNAIRIFLVLLELLNGAFTCLSSTCNNNNKHTINII